MQAGKCEVWAPVQMSEEQVPKFQGESKIIVTIYHCCFVQLCVNSHLSHIFWLNILIAHIEAMLFLLSLTTMKISPLFPA